MTTKKSYKDLLNIKFDPNTIKYTPSNKLIQNLLFKYRVNCSVSDFISDLQNDNILIENDYELEAIIKDVAYKQHTMCKMCSDMGCRSCFL